MASQEKKAELEKNVICDTDIDKVEPETSIKTNENQLENESRQGQISNESNENYKKGMTLDLTVKTTDIKQPTELSGQQNTNISPTINHSNNAHGK